MYNITPLVRSLIIINVVVGLLQYFLHITYILELWPLNTPYFEPYQFLSYMFAHGSFSHIFFNLMMFASIGPTLETYWGEKKFLFFYMASGIGAGVIYGLVNYFFYPGLLHPMLGASGAIYGVLMAFGMVFPELELSLLFLPISIKAKYLVFILGGITYFFDTSGQVAHFAHLGGAIVGFIIVSYWKSQDRGRY